MRWICAQHKFTHVLILMLICSDFYRSRSTGKKRISLRLIWLKTRRTFIDLRINVFSRFVFANWYFFLNCPETLQSKSGTCRPKWYRAQVRFQVVLRCLPYCSIPKRCKMAPGCIKKVYTFCPIACSIGRYERFLLLFFLEFWFPIVRLFALRRCASTPVISMCMVFRLAHHSSVRQSPFPPSFTTRVLFVCSVRMYVCMYIKTNTPVEKCCFSLLLKPNYSLSYMLASFSYTFFLLQHKKNDDYIHIVIINKII